MQDTAHQRSPRLQYLVNENPLQEERNGVTARLYQQVKSIEESISARLELTRPERSTRLYSQSTKLKVCTNYSHQFLPKRHDILYQGFYFKI